MPKYREIEEKDNAAVAALIRDNLKKHKLDIPGTILNDIYQFIGSKELPDDATIFCINLK